MHHVPPVPHHPARDVGPSQYVVLTHSRDALARGNHRGRDLPETTLRDGAGQRLRVRPILEDRVHGIAAEEAGPGLSERIAVTEKVDGDDLFAESHHGPLRLDRSELRHERLHALTMAD